MSLEYQMEVIIQNPNGLHIRPITAFVMLAQKFQSAIWVTYEGQTVNGKRMLELLSLGATCEGKLLLRAQGEDAQEAIAQLVALVDRKFDCQVEE